MSDIRSLYDILDDYQTRHMESMGITFESMARAVYSPDASAEEIQRRFHELDEVLAYGAIRKYREEIETLLVGFLCDEEVENAMLEDLIPKIEGDSVSQGD